MSQPAHDRIPLAVIRFLGWSAIIAIVGVIYLVHQATGYDKIDPATVALVAGVSTLAGACIGGLTAMLASTRGNAPMPVTVQNPPTDPVPVDAAASGDDL